MKKIKKNLTNYCISHDYIDYLDTLNIKIIGSNGYKKKYPSHWLNDASGKNISKKNENFGTLTSIYWIWKNRINSKNINKNNYIAINHYRRFWLKKNHSKKINLTNLKDNILRDIPKKYLNYDAFVCKPIDLRNYKFSKLIKKAKLSILKDPSILFNNNKHTINLHFDMFHIKNGLINAINLMDSEDRNDFLKYVKTKTNFFPLSIFIIKIKYFDALCSSTFQWLKKCEKLFNKKKLEGYGKVRIFDFLAERYFSFWISKYCKFKVWPYALIETRNNKKI